MTLAVDLALFILALINTILNSIGACVLIILYLKEKSYTQETYLINLSILEVLTNLVELIKRVPEMFSHIIETSLSIKYLSHYAAVGTFTGIRVAHYFITACITIDRFLMIRLSFYYRTHGRHKSVRCVLFLMWLLCLLIPVTICVAESKTDFHYQPVFYRYIYPSLDIGYVILAIVVYSYIFYRYQKSYKMDCRKISGRPLRRSTTTEAFVDSRFYTTILLVINFVVFVIIPDATYMFVGIRKEHHFHHGNLIAESQSDVLLDICRISFAVSSFFNFFIYIFFKPTMQKTISKQLRRLKRRFGISLKIFEKQNDCYAMDEDGDSIEIQHLDSRGLRSKERGYKYQRKYGVSNV